MLVVAVQQFPTPHDLRTLCQFFGLSSYHQQFTYAYAAIAKPIHRLTCKNVKFVWNDECQAAFDQLKVKLTTAPLLSYPQLDKGFVLEMDTSICGLGAVLSQEEDDGMLHPVAYTCTSHFLLKPEVNYSKTELKTLAVVWAVIYS